MSKRKAENMTPSEEAEAEAERLGKGIDDEDDDDEDEDDEIFAPGGEDEEDEESDDDGNEPQLITKHKKKTPPDMETHVCRLCKKTPPALFSECNHFYCCFNCYTNTHTAAAHPSKSLPSYCPECEEQVYTFFYVAGAAEREEVLEANQRPKRQCTVQRAPILEKSIAEILGAEHESPSITKCSVDSCKRGGRYMALHRATETACYTAICVDHKELLEEKCPICKLPVNGYYLHERAKK